MDLSYKELLTKNVKAFDACALLKALHFLGYCWDDLFFQGVSHHTSNPSLWEGVSFHDSRYPKVSLSINLGLLSNASPLPSHFFKKIDNDLVAGERFIRFINFFNHHLIKEFLKNTLIEENKHFFPNWIETQRHYISLLALNSLSTINFLVLIIFPEFDVIVTKNPKRIILDDSGFFLGKGKIGEDEVLGGNATKTFCSFKITLFIDEETSDLELPWPIEVHDRLRKLLFPLLQKVDIHLTLTLIIRKKKGQMILSPDSHLGFERVGKSPYPFELMIFHGHIKDLENITIANLK